MTTRQGTTNYEARAACFNLRSRTDDRQSGIHERGGAGAAGLSRAGPGCRRQRHSSGACKCARIKRLGQRSQRHRQRGQSARDTAASHYPRARTHSIRSCWYLPNIPYLPNVPGAAIGQDETHAVCGIRISSLGCPSGGQGERQAARPQDYKHLQGMLIDIRDAWRVPLVRIRRLPSDRGHR